MNASPASSWRRTLRNSFSSFEREHRLAHPHDARPERLVLDVAHHPALERPPDLRRALDRRHPADDRLALDVLQDRLAVGRAQRVDRQRDRRQVVRVQRPLVARRPRLRAPRRDPQPEAVVGDVVVQVDEARVDDRVRARSRRGWHPRSPAVARRRPRATATIAPSRSMYIAPSGISGRASSNVTRCPVTTSGAGRSGGGATVMSRTVPAVTKPCFTCNARTPAM